MKKFNVTITETTIQTYETCIMADDEDQAEKMAREAFENREYLSDGWERNDGGGVEFDIEPA